MSKGKKDNIHKTPEHYLDSYLFLFPFFFIVLSILKISLIKHDT